MRKGFGVGKLERKGRTRSKAEDTVLALSDTLEWRAYHRSFGISEEEKHWRNGFINILDFDRDLNDVW